VELSSPHSTEVLALEAVDQGLVRTALLRLSDEHRSVLVLRYYHDLTYEEIARVLVIPIGTVRSRVHNGLARLKQHLVAAEVMVP
jgi:RNA polymerase sigma-70 factor, ECF subfamily